MKFRELIRAVLLFLVLLAVGLLVVFAVRAIRDSGQPTVVFADGSRFILLGTTIGNQTFTTEKAWHKYARRWLGWSPEAITISSGSTSANISTNALTVWFKILDANGRSTDSLPWTWYEAIGADGFRFPIGGSYGSSDIHYIKLEAYPRRQAKFELQFLDRDRHLLRSVRMRNPVRGPFPNWVAERLPSTHTNGPLVVTLESLTERSNRYSVWIEPKWKLETTDPRWREAKPSRTDFEDPTGNRGRHLSFAEQAWKLTLPFRRPDSRDYSNEEKFLLSDLAVPEPGSVHILEREFVRMGVKFNVQCLVGVGTLAITNRTSYAMIPKRLGYSRRSDAHTTVETWGSMKPFLLIESGPPDPLDEIRFRLISSDGREIPLESSGWYGTPEGGRKYQQKFDVTNDISSMSLEVIVSRARLFEFMVDPTEVQRAKPKQ